jgi:hypothetical protein
MMNQGEWLEAVRRFFFFPSRKIEDEGQQQQLLMRQLGRLSVTASQGATFFS